MILSVDREKKKISFGLKPSYFFDEDLQDDQKPASDIQEDLISESDKSEDGDEEMQDPDADEDSMDEEVGQYANWYQI